MRIPMILRRGIIVLLLMIPLKTHAQVTVRGDVAWVTYYWTDGGMTDGKRTSSRGKSTRIFVRENGRWLCIHGHYTLAP